MEDKNSNMSSPTGGEDMETRRPEKRPRRIFSDNDDDDDIIPYEQPAEKRPRLVKPGESNARLEVLENNMAQILKLLKDKRVHDTEKESTDGLSLHDEYSLFSQTFRDAEEKESEEFEFSYDYGTALLGSTLPKTSTSRLGEIERLQHFNSSDWTNVRYAEVQKKYLSSPGGTSLEPNDILRQYEDKQVHLRSLDQTFAALTNMLLSQKEALQTAVKELLSWCNDKNTSLSSVAVTTKIRNLFSEDSALKTVSKDLMQVVCGRRADIVQQRRDKILANVRDKYNKVVLRRIPPTSEHLFHSAALDEAIAKLGGSTKVFFRKPYPLAESGQAVPGRSSDPVVKKPFQGSTSGAPASTSTFRTRESTKGKSLVGKRPFAAAKNQNYKSRRDDFDRRKRQ